MRDWKLGISPNCKEIFIVAFQKEKEDYLWRKSTISQRICRKITVSLDFQPKFPDFVWEMVSTHSVIAWKSSRGGPRDEVGLSPCPILLIPSI